MKQELPAVQKAYDLSKEMLIRVSKFPRSYKFTLGDRMVLTVLNILESLIEAAYSDAQEWTSTSTRMIIIKRPKDSPTNGVRFRYPLILPGQSTGKNV